MDDLKPPTTRKHEEDRRPRLWKALRIILRTRIVAGLLTVIPIWVTYYVIKFVFDLMKSWTEPLAWKVARLLQYSPKPLVASTVEAYVNWIVPVIAILLTLFLLYVLGLLTANVFGLRIIRFFERGLERVPMVKTIYRSTKQIVASIGGADPTKYHRVVLVEIPQPGMKRIAFLTSVMTDADTGRELANVFIPYTPYVTTGYMQIVPLDHVSETGWTFEEAAKLIMSGGIITPPSVPFDRPQPVHWSKTEANQCGTGVSPVQHRRDAGAAPTKKSPAEKPPPEAVESGKTH